ANRSFLILSYILLLLVSVLSRPPSATLFPYTTLFRSWDDLEEALRTAPPSAMALVDPGSGGTGGRPSERLHDLLRAFPSTPVIRSEEHTSELQSRENLVCRLLLEKKNNQNLTVHAARM